MPHSPNLLPKARETTPQPGLLGSHTNKKVTFPITRTVQREPQKVDRFRALPVVFLRMLVGEPTKFDELGLAGFQCQVELPQPLTQFFLEAESIRPILEAHHKVIYIPHQVGFTL